MKPTLMLMAIALAVSACTRTDPRLATRAIPGAHAAAVGAEREPLATLPPMSPDADDLKIVDYSTGD